MDISHFLQSVMQKMPPETVIRDYIVRFLQEKGVEIDRKTIQIQKNNLVFIDVSPIIKAKVVPLYPDLLTGLQEYLQEKEVKITIKKII